MAGTVSFNPCPPQSAAVYAAEMLLHDEILQQSATQSQLLAKNRLSYLAVERLESLQNCRSSCKDNSRLKAAVVCSCTLRLLPAFTGHSLVGVEHRLRPNSAAKALMQFCEPRQSFEAITLATVVLKFASALLLDIAIESQYFGNRTFVSPLLPVMLPRQGSNGFQPVSSGFNWQNRVQNQKRSYF